MALQRAQLRFRVTALISNVLPPRLRNDNPGQPEANRIATAARSDAEPDRTAAVGRGTGPRPAPIDPFKARRRSMRIGPRTGRVAFVPIPTPLPNVADHVVQPESIRRKTPNWRRKWSAACAVGRVIALGTCLVALNSHIIEIRRIVAD